MKTKKILLLTLAIIIMLAFAACGDSNSSKDNDKKSDAEKAVDNLIDEVSAPNSYSLEAADKALADRGVSKIAVEPDWEYTVDENKNQAYGDSSHGVIRFTKKFGLMEDEADYEIWLKKVFDATLKASDDGYNIQGFSFGGGDIEKTWEEFITSESFIQTWSYKYNGVIMDVYVEQTKEKSSDYGQDDTGAWVWTHYYNGVQVDISTGSQKSWSEYEADMEKAFAEYGDEIEDALKDYVGN